MGNAVIESYLKALPAVPGVYRMIGINGEVLYVGKAKNLKRRVSSYTNPNSQSHRIRHMIGLTRTMEFVTTHTEAEALLLEANLIKELTPRYNVLLRDDKSFPYILITDDHDYPQILKYRGPRKKRGNYYGPFASAGSVNDTLALLQRIFLLRSCTDTVFSSRTRPCLLHQIKRCSAPCVDITDRHTYEKLVEQARAFLSGKSHNLQKRMAEEMELLSKDLQFEQAAVLRDRIRAITTIQSHQSVNTSRIQEADIIALYRIAGRTCIQVFFLRSGNNYGNRAYYPRRTSGVDERVIMNAFLGQFYSNKKPPRLVLLSHDVNDEDVLLEALAERAGRAVTIKVPRRGTKKMLVKFALDNAKSALNRHLIESATQRQLLRDLSLRLGLEQAPERVEVYDNSHISGTNAVGAMIASGPDGFMKDSYRKFNIRATGNDQGQTLNDDYAMMREVLTRRLSRVQGVDPDRSKGQWPDLIVIDGGAGHLSSIQKILRDLGIFDINLVAIAKGPKRNAGREKLFLPGRSPIVLDSQDPVLYFLQRLRDEAHRFAIGAHRSRRTKSLKRSPLDEIQGVGGIRKKALLHHFGSARAVSRAALVDLEAVDGINKSIASRIFEWFHPEG